MGNLKKKNTLTAIILTYNEEKHIERCLKSLKGLVSEIIIIDSYSTDKTLDIAKMYKVSVFQNKFINQSKQINWAISNVKFKTNWIIRVDADEYFTTSLRLKLNKILKKKIDFNGISFNRIVKFFDKDIMYGGTSPHKILRMWRKGKGKCENLWMDEHIKIKGASFHINENLIDHNLNNLSWFINKHKKYAAREAISYILYKKKIKINNLRNHSKTSKYYKYKIYYRLPIFIRPILLFIYSYIFKLGFLTGWQGLLYHIIQVLYFRLLVDKNIKKLNNCIKEKSPYEFFKEKKYEKI